MAKHLLLAFSTLCLFCSAGMKNDLPIEKQRNFDFGEYVEYDINFGWFTVGEAFARLDEEEKYFEGKSCYQFEIYGETSGFFRMISKVKDQWKTYCDVKSLVPHYAYRNISEGRHTKKDKVYFHQEEEIAAYSRLNKSTNAFPPPDTFQTKNPTFDLLAGILYLRSIDYNRLSPGDVISLNAFYNKKFYDFRILFEGRKVIKTNMGKIHALQLKPELPENEIFSGKHAIRLWLSDDANKIPLKFEVEMFIGSAGIEIKSARGLKNDVNFAKR